jgi:hypothetical protein
MPWKVANDAGLLGRVVGVITEEQTKELLAGLRYKVEGKWRTREEIRDIPCDKVSMIQLCGRENQREIGSEDADTEVDLGYEGDGDIAPGASSRLLTEDTEGQE